MAQAPSTQTLMEGEVGSREQQATEAEGGNNLLIPEDGYTWKKYGQKFIKNIRKNRSYFKCQKKNCRIKKKVEWCSSDPSKLRVVYEGHHDHPSSCPNSSSSSQQNASHSNQYNLLTQVLGGASSDSSSLGIAFNHT